MKSFPVHVNKLKLFVPEPVNVVGVEHTLQFDTQLSKMSYLLRHGANECGLSIASDGFVDVSDLLKHIQLQNCTLEDVQRVVAEDCKQRYELQLVGDTWKVHATRDILFLLMIWL